MGGRALGDAPLARDLRGDKGSAGSSCTWALCACGSFMTHPQYFLRWRETRILNYSKILQTRVSVRRE